MHSHSGKFPVLDLILGNWGRREIAFGKTEHPLLPYFGKKEIEWTDYSYLANLENCLKMLSCEPNLHKFLRHLKQTSKFWQGYTEVETAALFMQSFGQVRLEPKLANGKCVDFSFSLDGREIFVEASTPKKGQKYQEERDRHGKRFIPKTGKQETVEAFTIDRGKRVHEIISREVKHFRGTNVPSLIIYNVNESEFDGGNIAEGLHGTRYGEFSTNRVTGERSFKWKRRPDTLFHSDPDPELRKLGGIICYRRAFNNEGHVFYHSLVPIRIAYNARFSLSDMEKLIQPFVEPPSSVM